MYRSQLQYEYKQVTCEVDLWGLLVFHEDLFQHILEYIFRSLKGAREYRDTL